MQTYIDSHFHLNSDGMDPAGAGLDLQRIRRATGVAIVNIACVSAPLFDCYNASHGFVAFLMKALHPGQTYVFGALDYTVDGALDGRADFADQARRLFEMGVDGFKMIEGKPTSRRILKMPLDAPVYDPFYAFLARNSLPLLAHVADPAVCWDAVKVPDCFRSAGYFYANDALPSFEDFRNEALHVAQKHPDLKLVLAHFFFASADVDQAARLMERYPNVAFDLTPGFDMYDDFAAKPGDWRDFFLRYDSRILFGTDNHLPGRLEDASLKIFHDKVELIRNFLETDREVAADICGFTYRTRGLHLPSRSVERIGADNFRQRLASRAPRPLDLALILGECRDRLERLRKTGDTTPHGVEELAALRATAALLRNVLQEAS